MVIYMLIMFSSYSKFFYFVMCSFFGRKRIYWNYKNYSLVSYRNNCFTSDCNCFFVLYEHTV